MSNDLQGLRTRRGRLRLGLFGATILASGAAMGAVLVTIMGGGPTQPVKQDVAPVPRQAAAQDPKQFLQSAERARARGDTAAAVRDLERARTLRSQQLGLPDAAPDDSSLAFISLQPGAAPTASRTAPRVLVAAAGSGQRPAATAPVYAGADLGQDAPDLLAVPPSLRTGASGSGARPTPLASSSRSVPLAASRPADSTADALNARQLASPLPVSNVPLPAPVAPVASGGAMPVVQAGAAPSYPDYVAPAASASLPAAQRYQPEMQEILPKYRPAPPPVEPALASAALTNAAIVPLDAPGSVSGSDFSAPGSGDPMLREIDRNIVDLRDSLAPAVQGGYGFRYVSGTKGLAHLTDETIPIEAVYTPGESGQIKVTVTREYLNSGTFRSTDLGLQTFGTIALGLSKPFVVGSTYVPPAYAGHRPDNQAAQGVGLNVAYRDELFGADIGATPIGFKVQNVVGGLEVTPQITDRLRLRVGAGRRAVTESLLSYAGTTDPRTGARWGGVVHDRGTVGLEYGDGDLAAYVNGGGGQLTGKHVANNFEYGVSAGTSYPVWRGETDEVRVGLDLLYEAYDKNLGFFTYGQGGYFSPQRYFSALVPVTYRGKSGDDLTYEVSTALGVQSFGQKASNYYPADPALQAQLNGMLPVGGLLATFGRKTVSGLAGNVRGRVDYRVSTNLRVGGQVSFQKSGDYDEAMGSVYARYIFNGTNKR